MLHGSNLVVDRRQSGVVVLRGVKIRGGGGKIPPPPFPNYKYKFMSCS